MLCGRPPFCGPPSYVLFHAIHHDPPSPRSLAPKVPRPLEAICLKALAKRPERYDDCRNSPTTSADGSAARPPGPPAALGRDWGDSSRLECSASGSLNKQRFGIAVNHSGRCEPAGSHVYCPDGQRFPKLIVPTPGA